ncbi:MAG: hypothetical protein K5768_08960 [Firmicutes bacterium]|jgi:hypothetical protein|nr:hypothetical protein [Bacillota bacterium]
MKHTIKTPNEITVIEPHQLLAEAIILQAVKDYRKALKYDVRSVKRECERFFRSDWFQTLTKLDGNTLINRLRMEVKAI